MRLKICVYIDKPKMLSPPPPINVINNPPMNLIHYRLDKKNLDNIVINN